MAIVLLLGKFSLLYISKYLTNNQSSHLVTVLTCLILTCLSVDASAVAPAGVCSCPVRLYLSHGRNLGRQKWKEFIDFLWIQVIVFLKQFIRRCRTLLNVWFYILYITMEAINNTEMHLFYIESRDYDFSADLISWQ